MSASPSMQKILGDPKVTEVLERHLGCKQGSATLHPSLWHAIWFIADEMFGLGWKAGQEASDGSHEG